MDVVDGSEDSMKDNLCLQLQTMPTNDSSLPLPQEKEDDTTSSQLLHSFLPTNQEEEEKRRLNLTHFTVVTIASNYASDMPYFQSSHSLQMGHDNISDWLDFSSEVSSSSSHEPILFPPSSHLYDPTLPESAAKVIVVGVDSKDGMSDSKEWLPSTHPLNNADEEMIASLSSIPMVDLECESDTIVGGCTTLHNSNNAALKWSRRVKGSRAFTRETSIRMTSDGFKWRKYGKKALQHNSYERNYYTCSTKECPAKKYVDCSIHTKLTLTSFEGTHSHPSPISSALH